MRHSTMMITGTLVAKYSHERGPVYLCHTVKNGTFEIQLPLYSCYL